MIDTAWYRKKEAHRSYRSTSDSLLGFCRAHVSPLKAVVDVGGGPGWCLDSFADEGIRCHVIGETDAAFEYACETGRETHPDGRARITFARGMWQADGTGTVCFCFEVMEHVEDGDEEIELMNKITMTGASLLVMSVAPPGQRGNGHINCQLKSEWVPKLVASGWKHRPDLTADLLTRPLACLYKKNIEVFTREP